MNIDIEGLDPRIVEFVNENGLGSIASAFEWEGGEDLVKPGLNNRRRTRIVIDDEGKPQLLLFMKRYYPLSFSKRLTTFFSNIGRKTEAVIEFSNIRGIRTAGVPTMHEVAGGSESGILGPIRSYILVTSVPGEALERSGEAFFDKYANEPDVITELTRSLVKLSVDMHKAGYVHRDYYASHIFMHENEGQIELYLIDLARAFKPCCRKFRWRVKDLAQFKFSMPERWVSTQWDAFISEYLSSFADLRTDVWNKAIEAKVDKMKNRMKRKAKK